MNTTRFLAVALLASFSASASVPVVSSVSTSQDNLRRVTVNYTLSGEPGIVTLEAQTNRGDNVWVAVDDVNLACVAGDVNKVVPTGDHSLVWLPRKSWPDQYITGGNIRIGVKAWATNAPPDYMVVSLAIPNCVLYYSSEGAIPDGVQDYKYKTEYLVMRKCPAANVTWRMGSPETEYERTAATETPHHVTLTNDFYIGVYPVTQRQYEYIMATRPSSFKLEADYPTRPVETVSYDDLRGKAGDGYNWPVNGHAVKSNGFVGMLRTKSGLNGFDLPTNAQWEFACRAGCGAALYNGQELETKDGVSAHLGALARYAKNGGDLNGTQLQVATCPAEYGTAKVGSYAPNAWGLYDTLGNVWEWCLDWHQESPVGFDPEIGPTSGTTRVHCGGGYNSAASYCRCAYRGYRPTTYQAAQVGFRIALTLP